MQGPGPSTEIPGLGEALLPAGTEGFLRLYCVLLWLEAEILDVLPKPLIDPLPYTGGQALAAALCEKERTSERAAAGSTQPLLRLDGDDGQVWGLTENVNLGGDTGKVFTAEQGVKGPAGGAFEGLSFLKTLGSNQQMQFRATPATETLQRMPSLASHLTPAISRPQFPSILGLISRPCLTMVAVCSTLPVSLWYVWEDAEWVHHARSRGPASLCRAY